MGLGEYPFSKWYGWIQDRYGLSWQLLLTDRPMRQRITPTLMFAGDVLGKAEQAVKTYVSVFHKSAVGDIARYGKGEEPDKDGTVRHAAFTLEGQRFAAMDSARVGNIRFTEAISFIVNCENQEEVDYYWGKLSAVPQAEICGWLKDKYGVSWQIVPVVLPLMLKDQDTERVARVTEAFLKMKKLDIAQLKKAYGG
jgi:predicted 3-demethylubiquinone-9 3-methyltransferase (glyoxalase superfamily)